MLLICHHQSKTKDGDWFGLNLLLTVLDLDDLIGIKFKLKDG